jgi:hypothetical protein
MSPLLEHLFCSSSDGALYDTRRPEWSRRAPLRPVYRQMHTSFPTGTHLRATLRAMPYALHDGDSLALLMDDGATLCHACAVENLRKLTAAIRDKARNGWRPVGWFVCYSGESELGESCSHCNRQLADGTADE